ncbi:hypothetical protein Ae201684_008136 [Aphanomyces euteiches]|uniref:Uncharacterized protein n=1 Tax=Aphanomyces euteiches TaxID=100861 RepID=A0A6G0X630_9STRA|nr:hypothetical protein Ae201684_008136 [Aphanomyces euteiches]
MLRKKHILSAQESSLSSDVTITSSNRGLVLWDTLCRCVTACLIDRSIIRSPMSSFVPGQEAGDDFTRHSK